jgi:hypothetical protein
MSRKLFPIGIGLTALLCGSVYILAARTSEGTAASGAIAGSDRLKSLPIGPACSSKPWPYYENNCVRDLRRPAGAARAVRIVSTDRLPGTPLAQVAMRFVFDGSVEAP